MNLIRKNLPILISALVLAGLSACSLAADVTPPPGYQPATQPASQPTVPSTSSTAQAISPMGETASTAQPTRLAPATSTTTQANPTGSATGAVQIGSVTGVISNGSGGQVPSGLSVTLHGYDTMAEAYTKTVTAGADGSYAFSSVEMPAGRIFLISVEYKGVTFNSDVAHSANGGEALKLPTTIYETSSDTSALFADRMHLFFDFSKPDVVQVIELYIISNSGKTAVVPAKSGAGVLNYALPKGASNLQFQDGELGQEYVQTSDGFGDTQAIQPGEQTHQVLFAYELPYDRQLNLSLPVSLPIKSAVVMVPEVGINAKSAQLTDAGKQDVQGTSYHLFTVDNLSIGNTIQISLSGKPQETSAQGTGSSLFGAGTTTGLLIGLGALALALIAAGFWLYRSRRPRLETAVVSEKTQSSPAEDDPETLMDAIAALDDLFKAGNIPEAAYRQRRDDLKARLIAAMK